MPEIGVVYLIWAALIAEICILDICFDMVGLLRFHIQKCKSYNS